MHGYLSATNPAKMGSKRTTTNPFSINTEGKLVISEDKEGAIIERDQAVEEMEIESNEVQLVNCSINSVLLLYNFTMKIFD